MSFRDQLAMKWAICPECGSREARVPMWSEIGKIKVRCCSCGWVVHMIIAPDDGTIPVIDERPFDDAP